MAQAPIDTAALNGLIVRVEEAMTKGTPEAVGKRMRVGNSPRCNLVR